MSEPALPEQRRRVSHLRPVLVNLHERATDRLLDDVVTGHGDRLLSKVRLADAIDADALTGRDKQYALSAHLDWLVVDARSSAPRFAVELDGIQHARDAKTRERDRIKGRLCEWAGLPLLRITSDYNRRVGHERVLTYVVDAFYMSEAFDEAQKNGIIPWDEPFDIASFIRRDSQGRPAFNTLDHDARIRMLDAWKAKRLPHYAPDEFATRDSETGETSVHTWLAVAPGRYLIAIVRVRSFLYEGIGASEVASQLAGAEMGDLVDRWLAGEAVACNRDELVRAMHEVQAAIDAGGFLSSGCSTGSLSAGGRIPGDFTIKMGHKR
jgi:very-short-patch-repair endonuclease